mgnify:CR=1 FL=1
MLCMRDDQTQFLKQSISRSFMKRGTEKPVRHIRWKKGQVHNVEKLCQKMVQNYKLHPYILYKLDGQAFQQ